ncbi:MAG: nitrogenase component 1 [Deltaproteobacteria bacterium]|nr:nitrogenase component 1 [Deltaproteobacteria bacterium]
MTVEPRTYQAPASIGACVAGIAVSDAVTVLHGGAGCDIKLHTLLRHHNPTGAVHHRVVCTKIAEADLVLDPGVVVGRAAGDIARRTSARLVLVTAASFVEIAGIDRERVVAEVEARVGLPAVYVYAPDFAGDLFDGYGKAAAAVAERMLRDAPDRSASDRAARVNIAGYVHDRPMGDHRGNLAELASLAAAVGLEVNAVLLGGSPVAALADLRNAGFAVALPGGGPAADVLARDAGQPRVDAPLPIGLEATAAFLRAVGGATGRSDRAEARIDEHEARVRALVRQAAEPLTGRRVALFADGHKVAGLLGICRDLRMVPVLAGVLDGRADALPSPLPDGLAVLVDPGQPTCLARIADLAKAGAVDAVVGPAWEVQAARRAGVAGIEFGFPCKAYQPLHPVPYLGYEGVLATASRILEAIGT